MDCFISGTFIVLSHLTSLENRAPAVLPSPGGDRRDTEQGRCSSWSGHIRALLLQQFALCMQTYSQIVFVKYLMI